MNLWQARQKSLDWRKWLEKNHEREQEVWVVYFKSAGGKMGIDYETSVEEALCFGWIDSIIQKIDEEKYARKFNPRRMDSQWSEMNRRRVAKVIAEGRMTEAGMAKVTFDAKQVDTPSRKRNSPDRLWKSLKRFAKLSNHIPKYGMPFRISRQPINVITLYG